MIPIFDSLTHPTCDGAWLGRKGVGSFFDLHKSMEKNLYVGACVVGLPGVGEYEHSKFARECKKYPKMVPIAGLSLNVSSLEKELISIKDLGFRGIKIHPRYGNFDLEKDKESIIEILNLCNKLDLIVMFCTYVANRISLMAETDPYRQLISIIRKSPKTRIVLIHGGLYRLLEYADLARFNENIILDLSYTLLKYQGSSLDHDIKYLFREFDRRICIGSDHPEYSLSSTRKRAEELSEGISPEKIKNIFYRNLENFLLP